MYKIDDINSGNGQFDFHLLPINISIRANFVRIYGPIWCKYLDVYVDC